MHTHTHTHLHPPPLHSLSFPSPLSLHLFLAAFQTGLLQKTGNIHQDCVVWDFLILPSLRYNTSFKRDLTSTNSMLIVYTGWGGGGAQFADLQKPHPFGTTLPLPPPPNCMLQGGCWPLEGISLGSHPPLYETLVVTVGEAMSFQQQYTCTCRSVSVNAS